MLHKKKCYRKIALTYIHNQGTKKLLSSRLYSQDKSLEENGGIQAGGLKGMVSSNGPTWRARPGSGPVLNSQISVFYRRQCSMLVRTYSIGNTPEPRLLSATEKLNSTGVFQSELLMFVSDYFADPSSCLRRTHLPALFSSLGRAQQHGNKKFKENMQAV